MANKNYDTTLKANILRLHLEEGRTKKSLTEEFNLGQGTLSYWLNQYRKECESNQKKKEESNSYEENKRLRKELAEAQKEISFLKKGGSLCEGNRLEQYTFIQKYDIEYGLRWLFQKTGIYPNAYYNYLKNRKK